MNEPDQAMTFRSVHKNDGVFIQKRDGVDDAWVDDEFTADEDRPTIERGAAYVSLGFISAALKRSAWLWCTTALFGMIFGYAVHAKFPPGYSATTSVLLPTNPNADATGQSDTHLALAQSQAVAQRALKDLGLQRSVSSFLAAYTVTAPSTEMVVFQVSAPSSSDALQWASAVSTVYLQFWANYLQSQQHLQMTLTQQQITQAQQQLSSINRQISGLQASSATPEGQAELRSLQAQQTAVENSLNAAQETASALATTGALTTASLVKSSQILNSPSLAPHSFKQSKSVYLVLGLIIGLMIGIVIVVIRALVSDRLRNRDDIADAFGAPIMFSTGQGSTGRVPLLGKRAGMRAIDLERFVAHLDNAVVAAPSRPLAALAVVAVDNAKEVVPAAVSLAVTWAGQGKQVVLADLADGAPAARQLGIKNQGLHAVSAQGVTLIVSVPGRDVPAPVGPLPTPSRPPFGHVDPDLAAACASADSLLTLVTLDPVSGGSHLASWANEAVAVVTAGRSSATRIRAVGEMIRLAGTRLVSVVLLKADMSDESLGALPAMEPSASPWPL